MRRRSIQALILSAVMVLSTAGVALAYVFPSTNDANRAAGHPHVNLVEAGPGSVTLEFVNDTNSLAFFEYRIDGEVLATGDPHPVVTGDVIYPGVSVDSRAISDPVVVIESFDATHTVEVRLALGGERDWDFDWVTFEAEAPSTKGECRSDWGDYGFKNQGQCVRFVVNGKDSR